MKNSSHILFFLFLFLTLNLKLCTLNCYAQPGSLDPTFGVGGKVVSVFSSCLYANSVAVQPDGKILILGTFYLQRYMSDGNIDTSFGSSGITYFGGEELQIQSDGKIVVASSTGSSSSDFVITRLNVNGEIDSSFSLDGKTQTDFGGGDDDAYSLAIQSDGKILTAGRTYIGGLSDFALARFDTNGNPDTTFDLDGKLITDSGFSYDLPHSVRIQSDGKILVGGSSGVGLTWDFSLLRLNSNGSLDTTFSGDGKAITNMGDDQDEGNEIAIQPDGKIVLAGSINAFMSYGDMALARYNVNGTLDSTFNFDGIMIADVGDLYGDYGESVAIQSDGKIIVGGNGTNGTDDGFALARINSNGTFDSTFSDDGKVITTIGPFGAGGPLTIQSDGKIIMGGVTNSKLALARYYATDFSTTNLSASTCDSYTLNSQTYTSTGIYTQVLTDSMGNDSILVLDLTINNSSSSLTTFSCDSTVINGQTFTTSGIYSQMFINAAGCDSTLTLNLTISNSTPATFTNTYCDSATINSQTFDLSGIYTQNLITVGGCDSVLTLNLTINNSTNLFIIDTACNYYTLNAQTYYAGGIYTQTFINSAGCDSIITLNLTIDTVDVSITYLDTITLQSNASGAIYQWLYCPDYNIISGATNQIFEAPANMFYAVAVTQNGCIDTSDCYEIYIEGINDLTNESYFTIHPNPTNTKINLSFEKNITNASLKITNSTGQLIFTQQNLSGNNFTIDVSSFANGIYFLELSDGSTTSQAKFVKE